MAGGLELDDLLGLFQPKPFYDSMNIGDISAWTKNNVEILKNSYFSLGLLGSVTTATSKLIASSVF